MPATSRAKLAFAANDETAGLADEDFQRALPVAEVVISDLFDDIVYSRSLLMSSASAVVPERHLGLYCSY